MTAREWFEQIRADVVKLERMEQACLSLRVRTEPHGQRMGSIGGGASDPSATIDALIDAEDALGRQRADVARELNDACDVLYGRSGRGGVAAALDAYSANCVCCYYLQAYTWRQVADELTSHGSAGTCRMRAHRALAWMDEVGLARLAES